MSVFTPFKRYLFASAVVGATLAPALAADSGGSVVYRITAEQYANTIASLFGDDINLGGRFEPGVRVDGLVQLGAARASVSAAGLEQYHNMAKAISAQVVDEAHRNILVPCEPRSITAPDNACASTFLGQTGEYLFRRSLTARELKFWVKAAADGAKVRGNFYEGLAISLSGMLQAPEFLFRREEGASRATDSAGQRLEAYSLASKLSFFLWNSVPDTQLMAAARTGELLIPAKYIAEVDRMLASPRLNEGVRAFFSDMLALDELENLAKDNALYPNFTSDVGLDAKEQTLRTITAILVQEDGDYRDIFTTRRTFLTSLLGSVYKISVRPNGMNGGLNGWQRYEYPPNVPVAGILTQIGFSSLHSHPGRSSPTLRGKAVREILLCQKVPDPPGNVEFTVVQDTGNPRYRTARARLEAHNSNPVCAGCHKLMDPLGYPLETFDTSGAFRATENGQEIDPAGALDRVNYSNISEFAQAVATSPATSSCLVNRLFSYSNGRPTAQTERGAVSALTKDFAEGGYRIRPLMKNIATSQSFLSTLPRIQ